MAVVLFDTSVASLLHSKKSDSKLFTLYEPHFRGKRLALSFQSVAELWHWAEKYNWGETSRNELDYLIKSFLIIPFQIPLAKVWAQVMNISRKEGRRFEAGDCWIAATAVLYEIPLLTHDKDFMNHDIPGLRVICYADNE
ncbi:PIN domain-containing protein [bacterium]|nr:PIN domain-containing protein [bacterium]